MPQRPWPIVLGPPILIGAAVLLALRLQGYADAGPKADPATLAACPSSPVGATAAITPSLGSWWKAVEQLDAAGTLVGRRLFLGRNGAATAITDLPAESSVSGPVGGVVVVTADDGTRSQVRLVSIDQRCSWLAHETSSVVRSAILDPASGTVFLHLVDRSSRADGGTWSLAPSRDAVSDPVLVAPPLGKAGRTIGTIWSTQLALDELGSRLAIQSCGDVGCVTRIFDLVKPAAPPTVIRGDAQGALLGLAGDRLVTWARCPGLPCAVVALDSASGRQDFLVEEARAAALARDGRRLVAIVPDIGSEHAIAVDPATGAARRLAPFAAGVQPLRVGLESPVGLEVAANQIVVSAPDGNPYPFDPTAAVEVLP